MNPLSRFSRWLGWTQDQYLRFAGWLLTLMAFAAGVALSYSSLHYIAHDVLGFEDPIAYCYPLTIDALVGASYITLWQLAYGVGVPRWYIKYVLGLGGVAAVLTLGGNALHGPLTAHEIALPLPWWAQAIGSSVPALALIGTGHSMFIMLSSRRAKVEQDAALSAKPVARRAAPASARTDAQIVALHGAQPSAQRLLASGARKRSKGAASDRPPTPDEVLKVALAEGAASTQVTGPWVRERFPGIADSTAGSRARAVRELLGAQAQEEA